MILDTFAFATPPFSIGSSCQASPITKCDRFHDRTYHKCREIFILVSLERTFGAVKDKKTHLETEHLGAVNN